MAAQVSIVTAARTTEVAEQKKKATAAVLLNPDAREFLPWWRLGGRKKPLSADAPEFVTAAKGPAAVAADHSSSALNNRHDGGRPRAAYKPSRRIQWQEAVRRTIFVKYIDNYVVDCRICGDSTFVGLRFGFVELQSEDETRAALFLDGTIIGICPLKISPSKTAIRPINPRFLPQVESSNLKAFCEAYFGKVFRLKLLDNEKHSTNLAFIEFAEGRQ
ncbi:hypothetical protein U9M48_013934 [Paspalum notatum var. saurae]|uniref:RRM domain-containing protein n=1 Tax=Paspalum notatum var. saurae TaxID=547442 RepID=A0AAQ3WK08_PASNO